MTSTIAHDFAATSVRVVPPDLPEPIPERIVHGYLNDELAAVCLRSGLFFKPLCRWCLSPFSINADMNYLCMACDVVFRAT